MTLYRTLVLVVAGGTSGLIAQEVNQYQPITKTERFDWTVKSTIGPASLVGGLVSAGFGTAMDKPSEYGTHVNGFASRYGMRMTGVATGNAIEAGVGTLWGEDPRYFRSAPGMGMAGRIGRVVKWTFVAPNRNSELRPAYARYIGVAGNNFLSSTWRPDSEADATHAVERIGLGFLGKIAGNAFDEFWPDAKQKLFHRRYKPDPAF